MTNPIKKANRQRELDGLAFTLLARCAMHWVDWYETTCERRGGKRLATRTFSEAVKRLVASGRVRKDNGCYEAVYVEDAEADGGLLAAEKSLDSETDQYLKAYLKAPLQAGNGNADITDIALQQLTEMDA